LKSISDSEAERRGRAKMQKERKMQEEEQSRVTSL